MTVSIPSWITVILSGVITAIPVLTTLIPPPYNAAVTAGLGLIAALYHLYTPVPGTVAVPVNPPPIITKP